MLAQAAVAQWAIAGSDEFYDLLRITGRFEPVDLN